MEITQSDADLAKASTSKLRPLSTASVASQASQSQQNPGLRPLALSAAQTATETRAALSSWGSNLGSFISQGASRLTVARTSSGSSSTALSQGSSSTSSYSTQPPSLDSSPPLDPKGEPQQRSVSSPPPLSSILSSWTWKPKPAAPSVPSKVPFEEEDVDPAFKPRDLGEFAPPTRTEARKSTDTGGTNTSADVQPGMAL